MKFTIYTKNNCEYCKKVLIPSNLNIELIDVYSENYKGFIPHVFPIMQHEGLVFEGIDSINTIIQTAKNAQEGKFKK